MKNIISIPVLLLLASTAVWAQEVIPLYKKVPNSKPNTIKEISDVGNDDILRISKVTNPTLTAFIPSGKGGERTAVIICPGGGYSILAFEKEGTLIAKEFNKHNIAAFVLKYRLPDITLQLNKEIAPLQDAEQAILLVRSRAKEWGIDPNLIGFAGFSAGGHLASTIGTHYKNSVIDNPSKISLRPDFLILCYPVISFTDSLGHKGSKNKLLGPNPSSKKVNEYSNELQADAETPPTFLVHAGDDKTVKVANSILFYEALRRNGVNAELHIYPKGGHGFGLNNKLAKDNWFERCINWMSSNNLLAESK